MVIGSELQNDQGPFFFAQVRDEYRQDYDPARGGYGKIAQTRAPEARSSF